MKIILNKSFENSESLQEMKISKHMQQYYIVYSGMEQWW